MSEETDTPTLTTGADSVSPTHNNITAPVSSWNEHPIITTSFARMDSTKSGVRRNITWGALLRAFSRPKPPPAEKHDLGLWCPTVFAGDRRKAELAEEVCLFAVDIDNEIKPSQLAKLREPPPTRLVKKKGKDTLKIEPVNTIEQVLGVMPRYECLWHTSFSHSPEWPKYRVAWLLKRAVSPTEYAMLWSRLESRFQRAGVFLDPSTKNVSRAWFVPCQTQCFEFQHVGGDLLDPDEILAEVDPPIQAKAKPRSSSGVPHLLQVIEKYRFVRGPTGRLFAQRSSRLYPTDSDAFASKVAYEHGIVNGQLIGREAIDRAMLAIRGGALPTVEVPIRFAEHNGKIYLDLGDDTGRVVEMNTEKPRILDVSPVAFYRPASLRPLPTPVIPSCHEAAKTALEPFRGLLSVGSLDWVACLAFVLQAMRQSRVYSMLICRGLKGVGKTTRARLLRRVIDPRRPELTGLPKTKDDLCIQAENAHMLVFDNLRYLDHDMSDALCRLSTGDGQEKRALYSDRDLVAFEVSKPIILTSISDAATEPDILDRALFVTFERPKKRMSDDQVDAAFAAMHPEVLGALCFAACLALEGQQSAEVPDDIRMQLPCRFVLGIEPYLVDEGAVLRTFRLANEQAAATVEEDPFVTLFSAWSKKRTPWEGTSSELLSALAEEIRDGNERMPIPKWMPSSPRGVRARLDKFRDHLRDRGLVVTYGTIGRDNEKRNGIRLERKVDGVGSSDTKETNRSNAPRESIGPDDVGVLGAGGANVVDDFSPGSSSTTDDEAVVSVHASISSFSRRKHPTHPTHPDIEKHEPVSGVDCDGIPTPQAPRPGIVRIEPPEDDEHAEMLAALDRL